MKNGAYDGGRKREEGEGRIEHRGGGEEGEKGPAVVGKCFKARKSTMTNCEILRWRPAMNNGDAYYNSAEAINSLI